MAQLHSSLVAERNGADAIFQIGGIGYHAAFWPMFDKLPVKDGSFEEDLCDHTWNGGRGYENYLCWDSAMDVEILNIRFRTVMEIAWGALSCVEPSPLLAYWAYEYIQYKSLCSTGSTGPESAEMNLPTVQCEKCEEKGGISEWYGYRIQVSAPKCDEKLKINGTTEIKLGEKEFTNGGSPEGEIMEEGSDGENGVKMKACKKCKLIVTGGDDKPQEYYNEIWVLKHCAIKEEVKIEPDKRKNKPKPIVLESDWQDKLKFTSLVFKDESTKFSLLGSDGKPQLTMNSDMSGERITYGKDGQSRINAGETVDLMENTWCVARAVVYNPSNQQDLFNQNWHAKLAPIDLDGFKPRLMDKVKIPFSKGIGKINGIADEVLKQVLTH
jgi:hypothetical protein